jgi:pyrroline-5-carboxylate reductase
MKIGLIGSGNMASALARGLGGPIVCSDADAVRAQALADELGGRAVAANAEVVAASEVVILCHKPAQLASVASELSTEGKIVVSLLGGVALADVRAAYAGARVFRIMPNTAVEIRKGVVGLVDDDAGDARAFEAIQGLFAAVGEVIVVPESLLGPLTGVSGVGPAYAALVAEAQIDAAVRAGFPAPLAARLVGAAMEGSAALLRERGMDTLAVRRAVTSPGGVTARGLSALEAGGLRAAFDDAMDAVLEAGA